MCLKKRLLDSLTEIFSFPTPPRCSYPLQRSSFSTLNEGTVTQLLSVGVKYPHTDFSKTSFAPLSTILG